MIFQRQNRYLIMHTVTGKELSDIWGERNQIYESLEQTTCIRKSK